MDEKHKTVRSHEFVEFMCVKDMTCHKEFSPAKVRAFQREAGRGWVEPDSADRASTCAYHAACARTGVEELTLAAQGSAQLSFALLGVAGPAQVSAYRTLLGFALLSSLSSRVVATPTVKIRHTAIPR